MEPTLEKELQNATANLVFQLKRNSGYLARTEIERILEPLRSRPNRLEQYGFKVYSQNDEDGILCEIFRRLGMVNGSFCEIGVENGLECNTLYLIHNGWRGGWIEGNERQKSLIENKFASLFQAKQRRLVLGIGFVTKENINDALKQTLQPLGIESDNLDFLSIDIDGNDIYLLESLEISPKVICIEYNAKFPPPVSKKPVYNPTNIWRGGDYMGSSLVAINDVAVSKGYVLVATNITGSNAFFVRRDLAQNKFEENSSPEHLYNPPRYWLFFDHFMNGIGHRADFGAYTDLE